MKKRFITIVSLLLAFVMSFALIACGNDGEGDGGDNSSNAPVISASLAKLRSAEGYKGTVAIHAATGKHANAVSFDGAIEKRGNKFKATTGEAATAKEYILDTATGYVYQNSEQGYYFKQYVPQGIADYAQYMLGVLLENAGDKSLDDLFVYDGNTHTATYKYDGADTVNAYLAPIISAYKNNSNLLTLVNNYLKLVSPDPTRPYTAEAILDMAVTLVASQPNVTMGAMIGMAANYGIDVYGLLEKSGLLQKFGITLDAPTKAKIEARKVAEFVTALDEILNTIKDDPNILENVPALIDKLFVDEVTVTDLRASLTNIRNYIVAFLTVQQVKPLVDKYFGGVVPAYMSEIYAVIVNGVGIENST
ncbi:MAG: hypothetical protein K2L54_04010 [Clostridiales bacterium]|nr:hypothetical protein [Clostridiales bacterium]